MDSLSETKGIKASAAQNAGNNFAPAGNCYDINWATWSTFSNVNSATGSIIDADGTPISINLSANYTFDTTPSIYTFSKFSGYPSNIPNSTVPKTTWAAGTGGSTTMCFSRKVTNPVLLLASLGSTQPTTSRLDFSVPYVVLYDGGGMVYNSSTALSGTEGYAIIMFPGDFTCVTISSSTPENYTNLTWGIRPQPFTISFTGNTTACGSATVTAIGGVNYKWNGGDTPNQATNTFTQSGTYLVTVTNANGCVTSASTTITTYPAPAITMPQSIAINNSTPVQVTPGITGNVSSYSWSPVAGVSDPTVSAPYFNPAVSTKYTLTVISPGGCTASADLMVNVIAKDIPKDISIPNTFTPNNDGVNDNWNLSNVNGSEVAVFTRWGKRVFYSKNNTISWNGFYNGKKLPFGVYFYTITNKEQNIKKSGSLTIIY